MSEEEALVLDAEYGVLGDSSARGRLLHLEPAPGDENLLDGPIYMSLLRYKWLPARGIDPAEWRQVRDDALYKLSLWNRDQRAGEAPWRYCANMANTARAVGLITDPERDILGAYYLGTDEGSYLSALRHAHASQEDARRVIYSFWKRLD